MDPPPPPRGFSGTPVANPRSFSRRSQSPDDLKAPPVASTIVPQKPPPPPHQPHVIQSFGSPAARAPVTGATMHSWRTGRVGGRHDSPLYGKHRKRPSSSSIDSNVSWSGSEIDMMGGIGALRNDQEQVKRHSWASSDAARDEVLSVEQQNVAPTAASPSLTPKMEQHRVTSAQRKQKVGKDSDASVQPPKTPQRKLAPDDSDEIIGTQCVRIDSSTHAGIRVASRANSSEDVLANALNPMYNEENNGPHSCPMTLNNVRQPQFSIDKLRQLRSNELIASKLLPTRTSVNSLMGYVRELQLSEATLRKQLIKTKQHTEKELSHSLSKLTELERTVQEVERDREVARQKVEEQEQLIRDLAAKLKRAEETKQTSGYTRTVDELPPIAEEASQVTGNEQGTVKTRVIVENDKLDASVVSPPVQALPTDQSVQQKVSMPPVQPNHLQEHNADQFALESPRSPNRPLWDPWASGSATPMKNLPPVFNIGSTGLDPVVSSSAHPTLTSTTDVKTFTTKEYELKSVLMSPGKAQGKNKSSEKDDSFRHVSDGIMPPGAQQVSPQQYHGPGLTVGASPSSSYSHLQQYLVSETQNDPHDVQNKDAHEDGEKYHSQTVPILPAETVSPSELVYNTNVSADCMVRGANGTGYNDGQSDEHPPATSDPAFNESNEVKVPPAFMIPSQNICKFPHAKVCTGPTEVTQFEQEGGEAGTPTVALPSSSPPIPSYTAEVQTACPAPPARNEKKCASQEDVSLETLLVDFFTEVDCKRSKMAKVYGKRYAGREKWLFAELTKRYGATKVAMLKDRFENSSGKRASSVTTDQQATSSPNVSSQTKVERPNHFHHPQFFHPPTRASDIDPRASTDMPSMVSSSVTSLQEKNALRSQKCQIADESGTTPTLTGPSSHTEHQQHFVDNKSPLSGVPTSFQMPETSGRSSSAHSAVDTVNPQLTSGPPTMNQKKEPGGQSGQVSSRLQTNTDNSNAAQVGIRQRHPSSLYNQKNNADAESEVVTLEGLLKELYKKHQPDKLKNVSTIAKQYAGKERELAGLLKSKYGALSVKRLEENLDVLERVHRSRMRSKGARKHRGCFVRMISLMFWLSMLLSFSFGAVFVSFVVLDTWECHYFNGEDQEHEVAEECVALKEKLETFTYGRVADYVSQSHPETCFCSEWKVRERALFATLSGEDFVNLLRMVPFSPESFGVPWIRTVKEQVPSQEFYDSYVKTVVDFLLNVGSFVRSSVPELTGFEKGVEKSLLVENAVKNESDEFYHVVEGTTSSHQLTGDRDSESIDDYASVDVLVPEVEKLEEENDADAVAPVEEENDALHKELTVGEPHLSATGYDVLVENVIFNGRNNEESIPSSIETVEKEQVVAGSINVPEMEGLSHSDELSESIEASEQKSFSDEARVEENLMNDDFVRSTDDESVSEANDVSSAFAETEGENIAVAMEEASLNDVNEESNVAFEANDGISGKDIAENVVEVEMHQVGIDLSNPETATDGMINDTPTDVTNLTVDEDLFSEVLVDSQEDSIGLSMSGGDERSLDPAHDSTDADADVTNSVAIMDTAVSEVDMENFEDSSSLNVEEGTSSVHVDVNLISTDADEEPSSVHTDEVPSNWEVSRAESSRSGDGDGTYGDEVLTPLHMKESEDEEVAAIVLNVRPDGEGGEIESNVIETGPEAKVDDVEEDILSALVDGSKERLVLEKSEPEQFSVSSDVNAREILSEEVTAHMLDGITVGYESDRSDDDKSVASAVVEELLSKNRDESVFEIAEESVEVEGVTAESELEEIAGAFSDDDVVFEKAKNFNNYDSGLKDEVVKASASSAHVELSTDSFPKAIVDNLEKVLHMEEFIADDNSSILREVEEQAVDGIDLVSKLDELFPGAVNDFGDVTEVNARVEDAETTDASETYVEVEFLAAGEVKSSQQDYLAGDEKGLGVADKEALTGEEVKGIAVASMEALASEGVALEEDLYTNVPGSAIDEHHAASLADGLSAIEDETTNSQQQVVNKSSVYSNNGLATMNEVLARLVKPFESAKTAAPVVSTDPEPEVEEM